MYLGWRASLAVTTTTGKRVGPKDEVCKGVQKREAVKLVGLIVLSFEFIILDAMHCSFRRAVSVSSFSPFPWCWYALDLQ